MGRATDLLLKLGAIPLSLAAFNVLAFRASLTYSSNCDIALDSASIRQTYAAIGVPIPEAVDAYVRAWNAEYHMPGGQGFQYAIAQRYSSSICKVGPVTIDGSVSTDPNVQATIHSILGTPADDRTVPVWEPGLEALPLEPSQLGTALRALNGSQMVRGRMQLRNGGNGDARNVTVLLPFPVSLPDSIPTIPAGNQATVTFEFPLTLDLVDSVAAVPVLRWDEQGPDSGLLAAIVGLLVILIWLPAVVSDIARSEPEHESAAGA